MTLLAPWALWLAAVGGAVVALYILKIKRRRQSVPALEFWRQLAGPAPVRSLFERLKRWWSMLLWLAITACLVLAIGNPILTFGRIKPRSIAVILDNSASMHTVEATAETETGASRFDLARRKLNEITTRRPVRDEWLLIEAGREPRVRQGWTRRLREVRDAAASIEPYAGASDLDAARELAGQLLAGRQRPTIVIISDGGAATEPPDAQEESDSPDVTVAYWPIGETADNLGITRLRARPHRQQSAHHVYVRLVNESAEAVETQLVFELGGSTTAVEPLTVEAGGTWEQTVVLEAPDGGVLRVWIDRPDALPLDDEAYAILPPIEAAAVLLVTPSADAFFFEQALMAMDPLVAAEASRTVSAGDYDALGPPPEPPDLTIVNAVVPDRLPASGPVVFIDAWPSDVPARVVGELDTPQMTVALRDHPLTRYINLRPVTLAKAREVDLTGRVTVLARSTEGAPLIFLDEQPGRRALCLAFDVLDSDLPFRNAFPLFLRNAVAYLVDERSTWIHDQYEIGEVIESLRPLPVDLEDVGLARLTGDEIQVELVPVRNGTFAFRGTDRFGPLRFDLPDGSVYTAVNLTNERESRIRPVAAAVEPTERLPLSDPLLGTVPWLALAVAATALIGLEWLTYHFRWTE